MNSLKRNVSLALLAITLQTSAVVFAGDDTVDTLTVDVAVTKNKADNNSAKIQSTQAGAKATQDALQVEIANRVAADEALANSITNISLTPGPQGDQGPQGETGTTGATGPQGIQGPAGTIGTGTDEVVRADMCLIFTTLNTQYSLEMPLPDYCTPVDSYEIGDTGPAGGIVFYITDGGLHGLEAAPADQSGKVEWGGCISVSFLLSTAIGAGADNTATILEQCPDTDNAAEFADVYTLNDYADWFLPSKDELNLLYGQKDVVGGFVSDAYWSSSLNVQNPWLQEFSDGYQIDVDYPSSVRAVRAF